MNPARAAHDPTPRYVAALQKPYDALANLKAEEEKIDG